MHEISLVEQLVAAAEDRAGGAPVTAVHVRYATTIPEAALRDTFAMLAGSGPLAAARLDAEPFDVHLSCPCGFDGALGHDDLIESSVAICPACGDVSTRTRTAELELLGVSLA